MANLESKLSFDFNIINDYSDSDFPSVIYRNLGDIKARDNFLKGNIWFCGTSQNRICAAPKQVDIMEYRTSIASAIFEYSCSFSTELRGSADTNVKITNVKVFIESVKNSLISSKGEFNHHVSWLNMNDLTKYVETLPVIGTIVNYPIQENEYITMNLSGLRGKLVQYVNKSMPRSVGYNSFEEASNAYNKDEKFKHEKEFRLSITAFFCDVTKFSPSLQHLVQYLKLRCPLMSNLCEAVI